MGIEIIGIGGLITCIKMALQFPFECHLEQSWIPNIFVNVSISIFFSFGKATSFHSLKSYFRDSF